MASLAPAAATSRRWRIMALGAFVAVEVVLIALSRMGAGVNGGDLCRDYVSAAQLLHGHEPYALSGACGVLRHSPHPPLALLVLVPLAVFPVATTALLWDLLMLVALAGALWIIWEEALPDLAPRWAVLGLAVLAIWPPLLDTWLEAQISPLVLLLLVLSWRAWRRDQSYASGAWLAVATLIRVYPVLLFVYPLLRRQWRVAAGGLVAGLGVTILTLPFIGPAEYLRYVTREAPGSSAEWINDAHNVSLRGWLGQLFVGSNTIHPVVAAPGLVTPLYVLGAVVLLGLLGYVALNGEPGRAQGVAPTYPSPRRRTLWPNGPTGANSFASLSAERAWLLAIPVMLLLSPLAWPHYFIVLLLPWLVLAAQCMREQKWTVTAWMLCLAPALLFLNAAGLRVLLPLPRLLPWPAALFVFALPFYTLALSTFALVVSPNRQSG